MHSLISEPKQLNKHGLNIRMLIENAGESEVGVKNVAKAFSLYPTLKWLTKQFPSTKNFYSIVDNAKNESCDDSVVDGMNQLQNAILSIGGCNSQLHLQKREKFIQCCITMVYTLEKETIIISKDPKRGNIMCQALVDTFGVEVPCTQEEITKFRAVGMCTRAFGMIQQNAGDKIDKLLSELFTDVQAESPEEEHLVHSVSSLIREYRKLVWNKNATSLQAKILKCRTEDDLQEISATQDAYQSAFVLCEYIKLIKAAANALNSYPSDCRYGDIIRCLLDEENANDAEIAMKLLMSDRTYARQKRTAYALFGTLLWGYDMNLLDGLSL